MQKGDIHPFYDCLEFFEYDESGREVWISFINIENGIVRMRRLNDFSNKRGESPAS